MQISKTATHCLGMYVCVHGGAKAVDAHNHVRVCQLVRDIPGQSVVIRGSILSSQLVWDIPGQSVVIRGSILSSQLVWDIPDNLW